MRGTAPCLRPNFRFPWRAAVACSLLPSAEGPAPSRSFRSRPNFRLPWRAAVPCSLLSSAEGPAPSKSFRSLPNFRLPWRAAVPCSLLSSAEGPAPSRGLGLLRRTGDQSPPIGGIHGGDFRRDFCPQRFRLKDLGMPTPPQNPALQVGGNTHLHGQFHGAPGKRKKLLRFVPLAFRNQPCGKIVETNAHDLRFSGFKRGKAAGQHFGCGKIRRTFKRSSQIPRLFNSAERKRAQAVSRQIVRNEIPLIADAGQMIGFDPAALAGPGAQGAIRKFHDAAGHDSFREQFKNFDLGLGHAGRPERHRFRQFVQRDARLIAQAGNQLLKGGMERLFEGRPPILLHRFLRHEQRHQFALANRNHRKLRHRPCIKKAVPRTIVFDGESQLVTHEFDVPLDGFAGHLEFPRERGTIGIFARGQKFVDAHHANDRRPGRTRRLQATGPGPCRQVLRRIRQRPSRTRRIFFRSFSTFFRHRTSYVLPSQAESTAL